MDSFSRADWADRGLMTDCRGRRSFCGVTRRGGKESFHHVSGHWVSAPSEMICLGYSECLNCPVCIVHDC